MIRVLIVDDHAAVRAGLTALLDGEDGISVVGDAADGREALHRADVLDPDVVLMDIQMPVLDGIAATRALLERDPHRRIVVLTTFGFDEYVDAAIGVGARGFLLKTASADELADAVRRVAAGQSILSPEVTEAVFARLRAPSPPARVSPFPEASARLGELTARERDVLDALGYGDSNAALAARLGISEATAKTHVSRVLAKLGIVSRTQGALLARFERDAP
ncbi:response regulator [Agromyces atrinae]|uniref:DNA-binding NarL/FixJ family response regulator n=1 Tax=Agromyces atrinae TaxID=592376 RepID=A0A4Q2M9L1_9MICO|nr:response regulator transcription factor [Agromyces atrinae]NYD66433.1 DNA-binding NarL/FixJ family response regulator [Agromyces atrinae]RXZ87113.1 response regulator transcription factor [Agromyces atrinae]